VAIKRQTSGIINFADEDNIVLVESDEKYVEHLQGEERG